MKLLLCGTVLLLAILVGHGSGKRPPKPVKRVREDPVIDQEELLDDSSITAELEHSIAGSPFIKR